MTASPAATAIAPMVTRTAKAAKASADDGGADGVGAADGAVVALAATSSPTPRLAMRVAGTMMTTHRP